MSTRPSPPPTADPDSTVSPAGNDSQPNATQPAHPSGSMPVVIPEPYPFLTPSDRPGELGRLGPYRVVKLIGQGGMGFVFRAEDEALRRPVALKVMRPEVAAGANARERFLREGRAAAAVKSDHVVTIYQVGEANGVPFLAMEFLDGLTLDDWLKARKGAAPTLAVVRVAKDVLKGLAAAHDKGLTHRDIKPANLWVETTSSRLKVLDFGLTRGATDDVQLTAEGVLLGTPAYMAPEQATGEPTDARADLFSLGAVLYRMLAGRSPFQRESVPATLAALIIDTPRRAATLAAGIPDEFAGLIDLLLAKKPDDRPRTARAALAVVLEVERRLRTGLNAPSATTPVVPADAPPVPVTPPAPAVVRMADDATESRPDPSVAAAPPRRPLAPRRDAGTGNARTGRWIAAGFLGLLAVAAAGAVIIKIKSKDGTTTEITVPDGATVEVTKDGKTLAQVGPGVKADPVKVDPGAPAKAGVWKPVPIGQSPFDKLDAKEIPVTERFDWQPKGLVAVIGSHARRMWGEVSAVAVSPDGRFAATGQGGNKGQIVIWDIETGAEKWVFAGGDTGVRSLRYSPDGTRLLVGRQIINSSTATASTELWELSGGRPMPSPLADNHPSGRIVYGRGSTADFVEGGRTVVVTDGSRYSVYDISKGKVVPTVRDFPTREAMIAAAANQVIYRSADGQRLRRTMIANANIESDEELPVQLNVEVYNGFGVAPDGRTLALARGNSLELWGLEQKPPKLQMVRLPPGTLFQLRAPYKA